MDTPVWLDRNEFPWPSKFHELPAGRMHYVDEGEGSPVLCVHGNPAWSFLYRHVIRDLSPERRVVAMDHLGFGLSDKPYKWDFKPWDHAANLESLVEALDLRDITLVVQDWGGPIGLSLALSQPERVRAILIMNTWMWPVNRERHFILFSGFAGGPIGRTLIRKRNFFAKSIMKSAYGDKSKLTPEIHRHYLDALPTSEDRKGCWVFPKEIIASSDWLGELWSKRKRLSGKPMHILWGMKDIAFREKELDTWSEAFPEARVTRLANVGHYVQEEAPLELVKALEQL
jgi:haloalkane dehalogenase